MNKKLGLAVAGALVAFSSAANAGITIPAGDWTVDIGGNVNAYYTNTRYSGGMKSATAGAPTSQTANEVSTGLLPSALGIGAKTRQNDLDIAFQFTFFTGVNQSGAGTGAFNGGNGLNSLNIRQAFLTVGDASWGSIKMGRDLGLYGSDAILSDMTLLGVGIGAGGAGNSTLGRIGSGYQYADWVGQIQYTTPNWNGFQAAGALRESLGNSSNHDLGFDGKVSYSFAANDVTGKVWVGGIHQKLNTAATTGSINVQGSVDTYIANNVLTAAGLNAAIAANTSAGTNATSLTAEAWEIGAKAAYAGAELVGYYYDGKNMSGGTVANATVLSGLFLAGQSVDHDNSGGYVQGTYVLPGVGTKLGASWGLSTIAHGTSGNKDFESESWVVGAYHPLTKSLNIVAEYTDNKLTGIGYTNAAGNEGKARTAALGAILFF